MEEEKGKTANSRHGTIYSVPCVKKIRIWFCDTEMVCSVCVYLPKSESVKRITND